MPKPAPSNVLYLAHDTGLIGGAERQLLELFKGLDRARYLPYLVCLEEGGPVAQRAADEGVQVYWVPRKWRWDLGVALRVRALICRHHTAIVHGYLGLPGFYGAVAGRLAGARVITTIRIAGPRTGISDGSQRLAFLLSHRIISNSKAGVDYYFKHFPGRRKTHVIYNGYDLADFALKPTRSRRELGLPEAGPLIGHVANLTLLKDYPTFLKALALVFGKDPQCRAVIVGDGDKRSEYEALAASLGLMERTTFLGKRNDVLDLVRNFDVCVLASHAAYSEGLSNSVAEYMGLARPVVATAVGGNRELIQDGVTGLLCPAGDAPALAQSILTLLKDQDLRRYMGERGRRFFEGHLTLETMANRTQQVYDELTREAP